MLQIKNLSITHTTTQHLLLQDLSFSLRAFDKVALISEEGNGKSTLLKAIADFESIQDYVQITGEIVSSSVIGYLPQSMSPKDLEKTVTGYLEPAYPYEYQSLFAQFDLTLIDERLRLKQISGGERIKIQMVKLLLQQPDILLLDEPSNDLDLASLNWLQTFINDFKGGILFVSHDEVLLEQCANVILHLEQIKRKTQPQTTFVKMSYRQYITFRQQQISKQTQVAKKQRQQHRQQLERHQQIQQKVAHRQRHISRQDPHGGYLLKKKMKSLKAQERRFDREEQQFIAIPESEEAIITRFDPKVRVANGQVVMDYQCDRLTIGEKVLTDNVHLYVQGPTKVGIIGSNGVGKSTLLKQLVELLQASHFSVGYMSQNYQEMVDFQQPILDYLAIDQKAETVTMVRNFLGTMRFTSTEMEKTFGQLSGGQQAKVLFLKMVLDQCKVLILDEPTRHFSPLSAPVVRQALIDFNGAIIAVSHDRTFLSEVCDLVYELTKDGLKLVDFSSFEG